MICDVVYDNTLSRVQISAEEVTGTKADIERSTDQVNWEFVRGGIKVDVAGAPVTGNIDPPISDYEFATIGSSTFPSANPCPTGSPAGVENFYRITSYNPESMLVVTGGPDSYAETVDSSGLSVTGDMDIAIGLRPDDWTPSNSETVYSKYLISGDQRSWVLELLDSGFIRFRWSVDGSFTSIQDNTVDSTVATGFLNGSHHAIRVTILVDDGAGNHVVTFYTADTISGAWVRLGDPIVRTGTTSIFDSSADVEIGAGDNGGIVFSGNDRYSGDVTAAFIKDGINGTTVASPDFTAELPGTTSFDDDQGNTWTVQSGALIKEDENPPEDPEVTDQCVVSITPDIQDVWLKSIYQPFLNLPVTALSNFDPVTQGFRGQVFDVIGRSNPIAITDKRASRAWNLRVCTDTPQNAYKLYLLLASGDPLFLQVPGNSSLPVPSMHIIVGTGDLSMQKRHFSDKRVWELPIREVEAPPSDIVGSTSTWQTVLNTYSTWQEVLDNHSSWADLLQLVGDGSEVIVS